MLARAPDLNRPDLELGTIDLTPERIRSYAVAIGDRSLAAGPCSVAPLGFALALRGGPIPEVDLAADTVSVHAGHAITVHRPLIAPGAYSIRARLADVFEKNGRSGPLTVIARRAEIRSTADGATVVTIDDQQIVRWRRTPPTTPPTTPPPARSTARAQARSERIGRQAALEIGALIGPQRRRAPSPAAIASYTGWLGGGEPLFTDRDHARSLGYADVIVPGPLQSAILEVMLRRSLPGWQLRHLGLTFRVSVIASEPIALTAVVVEQPRLGDAIGVRLDMALENHEGERAALGTAELSHG